MRRAFRPGTRANHATHFSTYLRFCEHYSCQPVNPSVDTLCLYATHLARRLKSPKVVMNYLSSVKLLHDYWDEPAGNLGSFQLSLVKRGLKMNMRHAERQRLPIDPPLLKKLCRACDQARSPAGRMLKCAILLAFYGFLRQSNLAPAKGSKFDHTRHTCRGDIIVDKNNAISILIKWQKNRQTLNEKLVTPLPKISDPVMDPYRAYVDMLKDVPTASDNDPLLLLPSKRTPEVVSIDTLRRGFNDLLTASGLDSRLYSLHSLRRGGASTAYATGAPPRDVQLHGGWKSQAFWGYIATPRESSAVAHALARAASNTAASCSSKGAENTRQ